ncbi:MAG TPA: SMP-30/gluconolactonase/LRE family protein [Polyangia bacterium]|nr:SMP-30/gluconolactonase/LRE family protein [Polyangia bacterium]
MGAKLCVGLWGTALAVAACSSGAGLAPDAGVSGDVGASGDASLDRGSAGDSGTPAASDGGDEPAGAERPATDDGPGAPDGTGPPGDAADASGDVEAAAPAPRTIGALYCPPAGTTWAPNPLPPQAQPTLVPITPPGGIMFLEGPVWLADRGVLLLSEWNGLHRILRVTPPATVDLFLADSGTNGLAVAPDGQALLIVTEAPKTTLSRLDLDDRSVQALASSFAGQPFVQPNDLVVRADGTIFFTDYEAGRLYRRAPDGQLELIASLPRANGVGLSPDETTLYLNADTRTVKYPLAPDGTVGAGSDLAGGLRGADGLAIDCAGNVFIAQNKGGSLVVMSPAGQKLGEIAGLPLVVTNAAFGGPDRQTLYITTSSALYSVHLANPGLPY